jgi:hypothetical protein
MKKNLITINNIFIRLSIYIFIAILYLSFMSLHAPLGTNWLEWHFQRIYNFSEYLKINGYFSNFSFSIWSKCVGCSLNAEDWQNKIYLSINFFTLFPYVIINDFFGNDNLRLYGNLLDKIIIIFTGCLTAELYLKFSKSKNNFYNLNIAVMIFIIFIINPWTYKMLIGAWWIIYFVFFYILSIFMFLEKKENLALFCLFLASCFDYQSSTGIFVFYFLITGFIFFKNKEYISQEYFPFTQTKLINFKIFIALILPVLIFFLLQVLTSLNLDDNSGSFLLYRIGISGDDPHNGGIIGALQFLGGNRISQCFINFDNQIDLSNLSKPIFIYNCALSIISMIILSIISLIGLYFLYCHNRGFFKILLLPIIFLFLSYVFILQQSASVHLMGYSYLFSILFSVGISLFIFRILEKNNFSLISLIIATPITLGIILLCIRVSMLTGVNG